MDEDLQHELTRRDKWLRLLYTLLYAIAFYIASLVLAVIVVIQFLWHLFTGEPNANLRELGHRIGKWLGEIVHYATYASEERPWPFGRNWPDAADLPQRDD